MVPTDIKHLKPIYLLVLILYIFIIVKKRDIKLVGRQLNK
jgi:hypothetical protein